MITLKSPLKRTRAHTGAISAALSLKLSLSAALLLSALPLHAQGAPRQEESSYQVNPIHLQEPIEEELRLKSLADEAYSQGDLESTLKHLQAAFEVSKNPRYIANQGLVLADSKRYEEAIKALEYFIKTNPPLPKLRAARAEVNRLRPTVKITSEPVGAQISTLQGELLGATPVTLQLVAGEHNVTLKKTGFEQQTITLLISPGKPVSAQYRLIPMGRSLADRERETLEGPVVSDANLELSQKLSSASPTKPLPSGARSLAWVSAGAGLVATSAYLLTRGAVIERDSALNRVDWERAQGQAVIYEHLTLISGAISALSAIGAGAWWLMSEPKEPTQSSQQP